MYSSEAELIRYLDLGHESKKVWQSVLDAEVQRWSAMSSEQLASKLHDVYTYCVECDSKTYQVEVQLLENTESYLQIMVAVDDGSLPASISPLTRIFIQEKSQPPT